MCVCCFVLLARGWKRLERGLQPSCPGIFSRTLRLYHVDGSPVSPLPHLLDGHRGLVGSKAIPASSCPGPVRYPWGSIIELEMPPDETLGVMTSHFHNTNVLQSIRYAKSSYLADMSNMGQTQKKNRHEESKLVVFECAVLLDVLCQSLDNYALEEFRYGATSVYPSVGCWVWF